MARLPINRLVRMSKAAVRSVGCAEPEDAVQSLIAYYLAHGSLLGRPPDYVFQALKNRARRLARRGGGQPEQADFVVPVDDGGDRVDARLDFLSLLSRVKLNGRRLDIVLEAVGIALTGGRVTSAEIGRRIGISGVAVGRHMARMQQEAQDAGKTCGPLFLVRSLRDLQKRLRRRQRDRDKRHDDAGGASAGR